MLPGQPRKKLEPKAERLLGLLHRWRDEAVRPQEIRGNFAPLAHHDAVEDPNALWIPMAYNKIPCVPEQGIYFRLAGN
jgi:hypothetical protein